MSCTTKDNVKFSLTNTDAVAQYFTIDQSTGDISVSQAIRNDPLKAFFFIVSSHTTDSLTHILLIHLLIDLDFLIIWFSGWRGIASMRSRSLRILFHHNLLLITNPDIECTYMQYTRTCTREIHTYMYTNLHTHSVAYTTYIDTHTHTRLLYAVARMIRRLCRELTCRCRG